MSGFAGRGIHIREMLRNPGMGIKGIDHVEMLCQGGRHFRQVGSTAAADDHHVNLIFKTVHVRRRVDRRAGNRLHSRGIPAGKHAGQFHVRVLADRQLHAAPQVAVSVNSDLHLSFPLTK